MFVLLARGSVANIMKGIFVFCATFINKFLAAFMRRICCSLFFDPQPLTLMSRGIEKKNQLNSPTHTNKAL